MSRTIQDGLGCLVDLREALKDRRLAEFKGLTPEDAASDAFAPGPAGCEGALHLAVMIGRSRLFAAQEASDDTVLPIAVGCAAGLELQRQIEDTVARASHLYEDWVQVSQMEREELTAGLLENRMDIWAAVIAIEESGHRWIEAGGGEHARLFSVLGSACQACEQLDDVLCEDLETLSTAACLPVLLHNWRLFLGEQFRSHLPWWLDGTLEETAARLERDARLLMPDRERVEQMLDDHRKPTLVRRSDGPSESGADEENGSRRRAESFPLSATGVRPIELRTFEWIDPQDESRIAQLSIRKDSDQRTFDVRFFQRDSSGRHGRFSIDSVESIRLCGEPANRTEQNVAEFVLPQDIEDEPVLDVDGTEWKRLL